MSLGPGKYDELCTAVLSLANAKLAVVVIIQGQLGDGFSLQCTDPSLLAKLPDALRAAAYQIEQDAANIQNTET